MKKQYFAPAMNECTICATVNILDVSGDPNAGHQEPAAAAPARKLYV